MTYEDKVRQTAKEAGAPIYYMAFWKQEMYYAMLMNFKRNKERGQSIQR